MATVSIPYALGEIEENNLLFWSIKDNRALLSEYDNDGGNISTSLATLKNKLAAIGNGIVTVTASGIAKKDRKGAETRKIRTFTINLDREKINALPGPMQSSASPYHSEKFEALQHELLNKEMEILRLKFALEKAEDERDTFRKKYEELEKESDQEEETIGGFSPKMLENVLISSLTSMFTPAATNPAPPINGIPEDVETWKAADADAARVISAILVVMKKEPETYKTIKNLLLASYAV